MFRKKQQNIQITDFNMMHAQKRARPSYTYGVASQAVLIVILQYQIVVILEMIILEESQTKAANNKKIRAFVSACLISACHRELFNREN